MKKRILLPVFAVLAFASNAQFLDSEPVVKVENKEKDVKFTVGARFLADVAVFDSDSISLQNGATISDARIRTSMTHKNWYFYADFGFGNGKFSQKYIYLQYSQKNNVGGTHYIKAGYYNDPAGSMSRNTPLGNLHFFNFPGSASALGQGRALGVSYRYNTKHFFAQQGVFSETPYNNKIEAGNNGITLSGRYVCRPIAEQYQLLHLGINGRFAHVASGVIENNVLKKKLHLGQPLETFVDEDERFVSCNIPWVNNVIDLGVEALYLNRKMFVRGEYIYKHVTKKRDSQALWQASVAQGNVGSFDQWLEMNPLRNNNFDGGYVEAGYSIFGNPYKYNSAESLMGGINSKSLEVVARYNHTNLNDKSNDAKLQATNVNGGSIDSYTIGLNYGFNKYALVMLGYTYHHIEKDALPHDKDVHMAQARLQFTF